MPRTPFTVLSGTPFYPDYPIWAVGAVARQQEFNGWQAESMSWKTGCYIHGGLSGPGQVRYHGPDAERFLSGVFVNNFSRFRIGRAKHAIACNEQGLIVGHGVMQRLADDDFRIFVSGAWGLYQHSLSEFDVQQEVQNNYLFQVAGPHSLAVLEAASGETLADVSFLGFRDIMVAGRRCEIMRIGMAGTLAYELHGPISDGPAVYQAVVDAGEDYGIERLGWKTYGVNHIEGGFPQQIWTFLPATYEDQGFQSFVKDAPTYRVGPAAPIISGSVDPADMRARYRTPQELGWASSVQFDHDFIGRAALETEADNPQRTIVTLVWNAEDIVDIYASLFREGEDYKFLEMPTAPRFDGIVGHADHVMKGGRPVGISSGITYSYYFRKVISHAILDLDEAALGNDLIVQWGDYGGRQKAVRATVGRYPYLSQNRNQSVV